MIIRQRRTQEFFCIANSTARDANLSIQARGLLIYMLSFPEDWEISVSHIVKTTDLTRYATYKMLNELEVVGYLIKGQARAGAGQFGQHTYCLYDEPRLENRETVETAEISGNRALTASRLTGSGETDTTKNILEQKHINKNARESDVGFHQWWALQVHKVGRAAAEKAFIKARHKSSLEQLIAAYCRYRDTKPPDRPWCNPSTWLNQERWLDEPAETKGAGPRKQSLMDQVFDFAMREASDEPTDHGTIEGKSERRNGSGGQNSKSLPAPSR